MAIINKSNILCTIALAAIINSGCKSENQIDKHNINLDTLETLSDNFYAYRRGRIYMEDLKTDRHRIWFNIDKNGSIQNIFKIEDLKNINSKPETVINTYSIDTSLSKLYAQKFIDLSRKYKFGHIYIDKQTKISFSYNEDISEQYVRPLNDSTKKLYTKKTDFKLLQNGWFEKVKQ